MCSRNSAVKQTKKHDILNLHGGEVSTAVFWVDAAATSTSNIVTARSSKTMATTFSTTRHHNSENHKLEKRLYFELNAFP
jgi:hypothetical protein